MQGIIFVSSENGVTINLMVAISFLPGGYRNYNNGDYNNISNNGYFWSASVSGSNAWNRKLNYNNTDVNRNNNNKRYGFSVRCVRDSEFNIISLLHFLAFDYKNIGLFAGHPIVWKWIYNIPKSSLLLHIRELSEFCGD